MVRVLMAFRCLTALAQVSNVASAAVESLAPGGVSLDELKATELKDVDPVVIRILELADQFVKQGVKYRRLKSARRLSREKLSVSSRRLSCSEFVWSLFSRAGVDMGEHPIGSKRLAFGDKAYAALVKVTDGSVRPGDVLVYANSVDELARQRQTIGVSQVGHVVVVVSATDRIVVGSHGRESTLQGEPRGAGYRRLADGWGRWSHGRSLMATYRVRPGTAAVGDE